MLFNHIIAHGLSYAVIVNGYLFILMITMSPRVWGYKDHPDKIGRAIVEWFQSLG